jgi:hypothetical protein
VGRLAAPLDLTPKKIDFTITLPQKAEKGWKIVLDPEHQVPEIYEGNNAVVFEE